MVTQYYRGVATAQKATILYVKEGQAITGINAELEIDADGDRYGDTRGTAARRAPPSTQPARRSTSQRGYVVTPEAIQVRVRSSAKTPVAVTAALPGPSPATLRAKKTVAPGKPSTVNLPISPELASQLARLDSSQSLPLTLRAHATKVKGKVSTDQLSVRLKGRG